MITIRRATLSDKPELFKFIQRAFTSQWQYMIPERWEWEYINNPHLEKGGLPVFIAVDESGAVIGQTCAMIEPVKIGPEVYPLAWSVDTYVLPEYRSQGIGHRLQIANDEAHVLFMSLSMSPANRRIKQSFGSVDLDPVPVYRRFLKFAPGIFRNADGAEETHKESLRNRWTAIRRQLPYLHRLPAKIENYLNRYPTLIRNTWDDFREQPSIQKAAQDLELTEVDSFSKDIDGLWEKVSPKFYAIVQRDCQHLNWKYVEQPHMDYARVIARRQGEVCGYVIMRKGKPPEKDFGMISDIFADPGDDKTITAMFSYAVNHFREEHVTEIIAATTIPAYQRCLRRLGFGKTGEAYPVIHSRENNPAFHPAFEPGKWFLGNSDHDWDQYPLAR